MSNIKEIIMVEVNPNNEVTLPGRIIHLRDGQPNNPSLDPTVIGREEGKVEVDLELF
jgi:hypothetical protein